MRKIIGLIFALWGFPMLVGEPRKTPSGGTEDSFPMTASFTPSAALDGWMNPL